jgi:hypothetical protein
MFKLSLILVGAVTVAAGANLAIQDKKMMQVCEAKYNLTECRLIISGR